MPALLKAATPWKRPSHAAVPAGRPDTISSTNSTKEAIAWIATVKPTMARIRRRMPPRSNVCISAWAIRRPRSPTRRATSTSSSSELVTMPSPPTSIRTRMIAWPVGLQ